MSGGKEKYSNTMWSLTQAASWIGSRIDAEPRLSSEIAARTVKKLHDALKAGQITGWGCIDGGERRTISREEWHDYSMKIEDKVFAGVGFIGAQGTPVIKVHSVRSFPAAALKYQGYPSGIRVPSPHSNNGEVGYHRVITDVLLRREQIMQRWPHDRNDQAIPDSVRQPDIGDRRANRKRPARERARNAIDELYPKGVPGQATEPNPTLYQKVGRWLKEKKLPDVSNDTILRAAGRRQGLRK